MSTDITKEELSPRNRPLTSLSISTAEGPIPKSQSQLQEETRVNSSYGSGEGHSAHSPSLRESNTFRSTLSSRSNSSLGSINSFVSIGAPIRSSIQSADHLKGIPEEDSCLTNSEPSSSVDALEPPSGTCCSCIIVTPKRFQNAAKFRKCPHSFNLCLVYLMFMLLGITEKGAFLVLFFSLNAYHSLDPPETVGLFLFVLAIVHLLYPVMGFIADTYFGRYKVILACLHMSFIGAAMLAIAFLFIDPLFDAKSHTAVTDSVFGYRSVVALTVGYVFITIGLTGIRVNLIPFGVDQITDASSGELSSYFHWFFWWLRAVFAISLALFIFILLVFRNKFQILPKVGNPFAHIYKVLCFAWRTPKPVLRSAFQRGQRPPPWIDRAMIQYGGRYTVEEVEDVKTFFRILFILVSFFGYFIVYAHIQTANIFQGFRLQPLGYAECSEKIMQTLEQAINGTFNCQYWTIPPFLGFGVVNLFTLLVIIVLFDRFVYTCLSSWKIFSMFGRITIGKMFIMGAILYGLGVEVHRLGMSMNQLSTHFSSSPLAINVIPFHTLSSVEFEVATPVSVVLALPQYFIFAFAELFASITIIEFIYAQSPASMKGLLLGCIFGTEGISMGLAGVLILLHKAAPQFSVFSFFGNANKFYTKVTTSLCTNEPSQCVDSAVATFAVFALISLLSIVLFIVAACRYKYRRRDVDPFLPIWLMPPTERDNAWGRRLLRACCY